MSPEPLRSAILAEWRLLLSVAIRSRGVKAVAVLGLAATWTAALLILAVWLLPAAEPYRLQRIVAEKLARHSHEHGAAPVLLSFGEPSMVYTMGRSAAVIRKWDQLYAEVDRGGAVVTAITHPIETIEFEKHPDLEVEIREVVEGFNLNKGQSQRLHLAVVRRKSIALTVPIDRGVTRAGIEGNVIK